MGDSNTIAAVTGLSVSKLRGGKKWHQNTGFDGSTLERLSKE